MQRVWLFCISEIKRVAKATILSTIFKMWKQQQVKKRGPKWNKNYVLYVQV